MVVVVDMISASVVSGQDAAQCSSNYPTSCQMLVVELLLHSGILWGTVTELPLHYGKAPRLAPAPPCTSDGCARGHPSHLIRSLCQI